MIEVLIQNFWLIVAALSGVAWMVTYIRLEKRCSAAEKWKRDREAKDRLLKELRGEDGNSEKDRRIYYQNIVYEVCNYLDQIHDGDKVVCGTASIPSTEVQDRMKSLVESLNSLFLGTDELKDQPFANRGMAVCSKCGNKSCPRAEDCEAECTGSNKAG